MLRQSIIFLTIVCLAGAGYFTYDQWIREDLSVWSFVPERALAVYENQRATATLDSLSNVATWDALNSISNFGDLKFSLGTLDSVLNQDGRSRDLIAGAPFLISAHLTSSDAFDFLYILEVRSLAQHNILQKLQEGYEAGGYSKRIRKYNDFTISELLHPSGEIFTFIFHKNYFIGSATAYLVEDAIRTLDDKEILNFREKFPDLFDLAKLSRDDGNLYFNLSGFSDMIGAFSSSGSALNFASNAFYDLRFSDKSIQLDGFTFSGEGSFTEIFKGLNGMRFDLAEIISNEEALFHHFSFEDPTRLRSNLTSYKRTDAIKTNKQKLLEDLDFDVDHVFNLLDQEIGLGTRFRGPEIVRTLYLEVTDPTEAVTFLRSVSERHARSSGDTLHRERFGVYEIEKLEAPEFPMTLIGPMAQGFKECYFTTFRNYLLVSSSLPSLKKTLNDIDSENTWRKSIRKVNFLEKTNPEASFTYFVNTPAIWTHLTRQLRKKWQPAFTKNEFVMLGFENIAVQFNEVDNKFFTNVVIDYPEANARAGGRVRQEATVAFSAPLVTKPFLVRDPSTGLFDVLVQDSATNLYLVDENFGVKWSQEIGEHALGDIREIDYYNNGNLQYVFATASMIHIIDTEGAYLPGFPKAVENVREIQFMEVIDYDGSKDYRLSLVDGEGKVFLTNKDGRPLEGWAPKSFSSPAIGPMKHFRIGGTDVFLVQLANGDIEMISRRGRSYPGFPIKTKELLTTNFHLRAGSRFASTTFTTITESGQLISFDLKGKITSREQLLKPSANTQFQLINDVLGQSFVVLRKTDNQYEVLDSNGETLLQKDYLEDTDFFAQFYDLSASKKYIVIGNYSDPFVYIYDLSGRLVTSRPLTGTNPVSMLYSGNKDEHQIYLTDGNDLKLLLLE